MDNIKEKDPVVLPDETGEKVSGGDDLIEIEYGECKRCGRQIKQKILDANFGICPYCEMETKPHPDNPYIPNYN